MNSRTTLQSIPIVRHANGAVVDDAYEHLTESEQEQTPVIYETLKNAAHAIREGAKNYDKVSNTARLALRESQFEVNRFDIVEEDTLDVPTLDTQRFRIICEVSLGSTILHDNLGLNV